MPLQGDLSVERMCQLVQVSRAGFYRYLGDGWSAEEEVALRAAVQSVVLEHRLRYGYRRVTAELRARGMLVNHKRVARIMREDNLLAIRHEYYPAAEVPIRAVRIHLNLASRMKVCGPNQLWIADITYIRLRTEFVYLAVILDIFSRSVVGWSLGRDLQAKLPLGALKQAIARRKPPAGLVHHSDQGVQYACRQYMKELHDHGMLASMSRPGNPYDNATCESFMKTLKREEIRPSGYRDIEDLRTKLEEFLDQYYNRSRLHSALGYRSPEIFEQEADQRKPEGTYGAAMVTFFGT
jgi:transposase InsO family protein